MISLETACKLKDAGLKWEPQIGDWYYFGANIELNIYARADDEIPAGICYAPRLDQLLAEIKRHSEFVKITWLVIEKKWCCVIDSREQFMSGSPEEAAAQALLWILQQKAGGYSD